jgi:hypothetical protein
MGDWLGTGTIAPRLRVYRPFKDARAFVRRLGLKSGDEWRDYCNSGKKPADIPNTPNNVYAKADWAGMGDWLGTGFVARHLRQYRPFKEARTFVHNLSLKSKDEWRIIVSQARKPMIFPLTLVQYTRRTVGLVGAIGSGTRPKLTHPNVVRWYPRVIEGPIAPADQS